MLDFLGEKLFLRHSTNNFRRVGYPPTDNGDFHKTQVIKLQEMKFKKQGKSPSVYLCYSYPSNCKTGSKDDNPSRVAKVPSQCSPLFAKAHVLTHAFPPSTHSSSAGVPRRQQAGAVLPLQSLHY